MVGNVIGFFIFRKFKWINGQKITIVIMNIEIIKKNEISVTSSGVLGRQVVPLNASKSESNRALVIQALSKEPIHLENLAVARDTQTMIRLLSDQGAPVWDVLDAGTTMRFLTAYLAVTSSGKEITGTERMQQRPIKALADALSALGASITYLGQQGYPPLYIEKIAKQKASAISIPGNISSQYISALLMIAPVLPNGLTIHLEGEIFSRPYIDMTLSLMSTFGIQSGWADERTITILPQPYRGGTYRIESDWSGASYWYSMVALAKSGEVKLLGLCENSYQGDKAIASIMDAIGVHSLFEHDGIILTKKAQGSAAEIDFRDCPDLAQTVLVAAAINGVTLTMTGLESLRIKETDRIAAMTTELAKIGATLVENGDRWTLHPTTTEWQANILFDTYDDHRMAMAFAPLALIKPIRIAHPSVVVKSYPDFWQHLDNVGFVME